MRPAKQLGQLVHPEKYQFVAIFFHNHTDALPIVPRSSESVTASTQRHPV